MNLNTIKTAKLRKMAEEQKIEGCEDMERKELIAALKPKEEPKPPKKEKAEDEVGDEGGEEDLSKDTGIEEGRTPIGSKAEIMKAKLAKQEKVTIMIPLEKGEKRGTTFPVTLNGYRLNIQEGRDVEVPKQVARIVMKSQSQTAAAINEGLNLDNPDHPKRKSGMGVRDLE